MQSACKISIIITTWNAGEHLSNCLSKLKSQTIQDFEIIIVDNGSTDGSLRIAEAFQLDMPINIKRLSSNMGFAAANNIGGCLASGEWLILLNADAYPEPDWLENLLKASAQNFEYNFFSSRQIQYNHPQILDGAGDDYHISGLAWRRFYNRPTQDYGLQPCEVFGACAAAAMYRRKDFLEVGGFDETFFSYFEDVDLSFRAKQKGYELDYVNAPHEHYRSNSAKKLNQERRS